MRNNQEKSVKNGTPLIELWRHKVGSDYPALGDGSKNAVYQKPKPIY